MPKNWPFQQNGVFVFSRVRETDFTSNYCHLDDMCTAADRMHTSISKGQNIK